MKTSGSWSSSGRKTRYAPQPRATPRLPLHTPRTTAPHSSHDNTPSKVNPAALFALDARPDPGPCGHGVPQIATVVARDINGDFGPDLDTTYDLYIGGDVGVIDVGDLYGGVFSSGEGRWRQDWFRDAAATKDVILRQRHI
jgi:hypothetical protein